MKGPRPVATVLVQVESQLLLPEEAAGFLRVSVQTLAHWRHEGKGPRYANYGGVVTYSVADLVDFRNKHLRLSTSDLMRPEEEASTGAAGPSPT